MVSKLLIVAQQQRRAVDLCQHNIKVTVAVDVRVCGAAADDRLDQRGTALFGGHHEKTAPCRTAGIPKKLRRLAVMLAGLNFVNFLLEMTVDTEQIQPSIQIVIEKENAKLQQEPAV